MDSVLNEFVSSHDLDEVLAGSPVNLEDIPDQHKEGVVAILLHCCINGPFSPHKVTNYPIAGNVSLDSLVGRRVSNNGLRKTCEIVSTWLAEKNYQKGYMYEYGSGNFWPQNGYQSRS
jgi:hypothetical protein